MPRRIRENNRDLIGYLNNQPLPPFTSTADEIRIAVERAAISRGTLLIRVIVRMDVEAILSTIENIARTYDQEDLIERHVELNVQPDALARLDCMNPPIAYPYYFCTPEILIEYPATVMYYRNLAMLS